MIVRLAERADIDQLVQMRWDFTMEDYEEKVFDESNFEGFHIECSYFLKSAIESGNWFIWVAEEEGRIVSHIYIELIQKVPRPGRITYPFAFMTNVYTIKEFRNKGIGSNLITTINEWAKGKKYEFIIVWPSEDSIDYYKKNGYSHCREPMEFFPS
ncbi:GNAT family N-acetyltransferase [Psychrobacillus sp. OK032]|uniref:GNAT family N-acetyltransferase n=1 Tax=Psychrobacillus sp. OK032 TaxID=1884358 RepID=UPI0008B65A6C|nr:GNAT family N-acetyltransferase [Psychrobacillus sp. OK032]SER78271.1 Acetyltransferase (GNAT) domain-containing protein [Psychrobacillus sp. OK032]